jgi:acetyl-CoA C-acetyltransferase
MSEERAKELGLKPLAKIKAYTSAGVDPAFMGPGPIPAVRKILQKTGLSLNDFDVIELNEVLAAQAIACLREIKFDLEKTNLLNPTTTVSA